MVLGYFLSSSQSSDPKEAVVSLYDLRYLGFIWLLTTELARFSIPEQVTVKLKTPLKPRYEAVSF